ncbi:hypothetical protein TEK04_14020 [Klenkia sp. LSe6-5]|uniref:Meckel syndrome type 1 protein n=1 Tax=Klenkia sesuvii TaxID=3103137 RepID=A0ABU8DVG6_9ACTN
MGSHRQRRGAAGRRAEAVTGAATDAVAVVAPVLPTPPAAPASRPLPLPPPPLTGVRGPATGSRPGSRGPATGSRGPATGSRPGSRGPATGTRRAPARRNLRWVPVALAIWIASFLAVPAAVLVHQAVSERPTSVENAAETRTDPGPDAEQSGAARDAGGTQDVDHQRPVPADATGSGTVESAVAELDATAPDALEVGQPETARVPADPAATSAALVVDGTVGSHGTGTGTAVRPPAAAGSTTGAASSSTAAPTAPATAPASSAAVVAPGAPVEQDQPAAAAVQQAPLEAAAP